MKLALFPLFHPSCFEQKSFQGTGLDFLSAYYLTGLLPFLEKHFPNLNLCLEIALPRLLAQRPDLVLIWSTTPSFGQVRAVAEIIKQNLEIPILLAGPHISHLPQSLPAGVDIGILGEPEIPLHQLLGIFLKDPQAGPVKYGKIPGLIYQSRGRIYSGAPAKFIQQIDQLPLPRHNLLHNLPGRSVPVVNTSRGPHSLISLLTQPPAARIRLFSPERIIEEIGQIIADYKHLYRNWPIPENFLAYLFPIYIVDELFLENPGRLEIICKGLIQRAFHKSTFFIVNAYPRQIQKETLYWLKQINTRQLILNFASFASTAAPWMPACQAQDLDRVLKLCEQFKIGAIGNYLVNPLMETSRREMAKTYWFLWENQHRFDKIQAYYLPPMPGTALWEAYQQKYKLKAEQLESFAWHTLDPERYQPGNPILNRSLDSVSFTEIMQQMQKQLSPPSNPALEMAKTPMKRDQGYQAEINSVKEIQKKFLKPGMHILEILLEPQFSLKPHLPENFCQLEQLPVQAGKLQGRPAQPVDLIVMRGALNGLLQPEQTLQALSSWLKPEGEILINVLNAQNIALMLTLLNWELERSRYSYKILRYFSEQTLRQLVKRLDMETVRVEYNIMNNIQGFKDAAEGLIKRVQNFWPIPVSSERLYIMEINMLIKKNRK